MSVALKIKHIVKEHEEEIRNEKPEKWLSRVLEDVFIVFEEEQQSREERLATKEDIKLLIQMIDKRFEAMEKTNAVRFDAIEKRLGLITWFVPLVLSVVMALFAYIIKS